jgi:threonine dehydrogenase-like Zn-dependent dehydrogenase
VAVDATAGNGHDTVFLAHGVGPAGRVYALDIQDQALENTSRLVAAQGLTERVKLLKSGHQQMDRLIEGPVDAVMFNLGYLPGSDRSVVTTIDSTLAGIKAALSLTGPGGRISIVAYTGHPGARQEATAVEKLLSALAEKVFSVQKLFFLNSPKESPELFFITGAGDKK